MRARCIAVLVAALAGMPASAAEPAAAHVEALSEQGLLQCLAPNLRARTCEAIVSYERMQDGIYSSTQLLAVGQGITLQIVSPVWAVDESLCGPLREQDLFAGTLRVGGRDVPPQVAEGVLNQVLEHMRPLIDQEVCVRFEPSGTDFTARFTVAGEHRPDRDRRVKIISTADGYRVAP